MKKSIFDRKEKFAEYQYETNERLNKLEFVLLQKEFKQEWVDIRMNDYDDMRIIDDPKEDQDNNTFLHKSDWNRFEKARLWLKWYMSKK